MYTSCIAPLQFWRGIFWDEVEPTLVDGKTNSVMAAEMHWPDCGLALEVERLNSKMIRNE